LVYSPAIGPSLSSTDSWMESMIKKKQKKKHTINAQADENPFEELDQFFRHPQL